MSFIATKDWAEIDQQCQRVKRDTWVIWDVDSTLIFSNDIVFGCQNDLYKAQVAQIEAFESQDPQGSHDLKQVKTLWYHIRRFLPWQLMDPKIPETIHHLQERNITTFALTFLLTQTPEFDYMSWRQQQLKQVGIDFSAAFPHNPIFRFPEIHPSKEEKAVPNVGCPTFANGIFYTHHCSKGECLVHFFKAIQQQPKQILFVDDSYANLCSIEAVAQQYHIKFLGIHYQAYLYFCQQAQQKDPQLLERWKQFKATGIWPQRPITMDEK